MIIERPPDSTALRANSLATRTACAADTPVTVLDHLRMAIAAAGWDTAVARFPDPTQRDHVAAVVRLDVVPDDARPQVADAFSLTESLRRQDSTYQSELRWRTSSFELDQGVPPTSRVSASEASRVDVARAFPTTGYGERRRADRPGSLQDHRAVHWRRHQPRGVAVRRSVIDRVARVHRCRHGHVHAHPSDRDHAEPNGHRPTHPTARSPAALERVGTTPAPGEQRLPPPPTTRDRGSAVPQLALPAASGSHQLRARPATRGEGRRRSSILCPCDCDPWSMVNLGHQ